MKRLSIALCILFTAFCGAFGQQPSSTPIPIDKESKISPTPTPLGKMRPTPTPIDKMRATPTPIDKMRATPTPIEKERPTPSPVDKTSKILPTPTPLASLTIPELQAAYFKAQTDEAAVRARQGIGGASPQQLNAAIARTAAAKKALDDAMAQH